MDDCPAGLIRICGTSLLDVDLSAIADLNPTAPGSNASPAIPTGHHGRTVPVFIFPVDQNLSSIHCGGCELREF